MSRLPGWLWKKGVGGDTHTGPGAAAVIKLSMLRILQKIIEGGSTEQLINAFTTTTASLNVFMSKFSCIFKKLGLNYVQKS